MKDATEMFLDEIGSNGKFKMLSALLDNSLSVNEIARQTGLSQTHVSHNLKSLSMCRFVNKKVSGNVHEYSLSKEMVPCIKGIAAYIK
ncbi:MAG: helix-turn-helix transcriptional regulator, partial [Candidatus Micrarchaeota archaeon]|nr:helix-turn-helix transcriptional regulator [Candidatus Micrarchaeota archaeon]